MFLCVGITFFFFKLSKLLQEYGVMFKVPSGYNPAVKNPAALDYLLYIHM